MTRPESQPRHPLALLAEFVAACHAHQAAFDERPDGPGVMLSRRHIADAAHRLIQAQDAMLSLDPAALRARAEAEAEVEGLHPETAALVDSFALELKRKLRRAEEKYGYDNGWKQDDWKEQCRADLMRHIEKGDPRDVAAYAAFMWFHGWSTGSDKARAIRAAAQAEHDRIGYSYDHISIDLHEDVDRRMEIALTALAQAGGEG